MSRPRITVTGGAGFLGSHLSESLAKLGHEVIILDNFSSGTRDNISDALRDSDSVKLVVGDCKDSEDVTSSITNVDVVYHFAANPEIRLDLADPSTTFQENIYATHILLETIRRSRVDSIVFASTSTVYGEAKTIPTREDYGPLEPISVYGASKLASEALIASYCHSYRKKAVILRLANIVGLRNRHGVINDFIARLTKNPSLLEIMGDGRQAKSYLHVSDAISAVLRAFETSEQRVEFVNVGSKDQITVRRIAEIVVEEMGLNDVDLRFSGGVEGGRGWVGDVKSMCLDSAKLSSRGWRPRHDSEESVRLATREILGKNRLSDE